MSDAKVLSRLKTQLTKFSLELGKSLSKTFAKFVSQILFGRRPVSVGRRNRADQSIAVDRDSARLRYAVFGE